MHLLLAPHRVLIGALVVAAGLKALGFLYPSSAVLSAPGSEAAYGGAMVLEFVAALMLSFRRSRQVGARCVAAGFLGAAIGTLVAIRSGGLNSACKCLGVVSMPLGWSLVLQGGMVSLAAVSERGWARAEAPEP